MIAVSRSIEKELSIAKNQNTFAKRAREMNKKRKADEKQANRRKRKEQAGEQPRPAIEPTEDEPPENEPT